MAIIKHCIICGKKIIAKESAINHRATKYCSKECYAKARKKFTMNICLQCNKEFEIPINYKHYKRFCSDTCIEHYNSDLDKGIGRIKRTKNRWIKSNCKTCRQEYWKWGEKGTIYCNSYCKPSPVFTLVCQHCNNEFTTKRKESKFCSVSCGSKYNSQKQGFGTKVKPDVIWNKGLDITDKRIQKSVEKQKKTFAKNLAEGKITMYFTNKKLTEQHKRKISNGLAKAIIEGRKNTTIFSHGGIRKDLGYYVRSGWEANFARILKYLNRQYDFEKHTFPLSNGKNYIPDFYDYKRNCYYEIKGKFTEDGKDKLECFIKDYPDIKLKLIDYKKYNRLIKYFKNKICFEK